MRRNSSAWSVNQSSVWLVYSAANKRKNGMFITLQATCRVNKHPLAQLFLFKPKQIDIVLIWHHHKKPRRVRLLKNRTGQIIITIIMQEIEKCILFDRKNPLFVAFSVWSPIEKASKIRVNYTTDSLVCPPIQANGGPIRTHVRGVSESQEKHGWNKVSMRTLLGLFRDGQQGVFVTIKAPTCNF